MRSNHAISFIHTSTVFADRLAKNVLTKVAGAPWVSARWRFLPNEISNSPPEIQLCSQALLRLNFTTSRVCAGHSEWVFLIDVSIISVGESTAATAEVNRLHSNGTFVKQHGKSKVGGVYTKKLGASTKSQLDFIGLALSPRSIQIILSRPLELERAAHTASTILLQKKNYRCQRLQLAIARCFVRAAI